MRKPIGLAARQQLKPLKHHFEVTFTPHMFVLSGSPFSDPPFGDGDILVCAASYTAAAVRIQVANHI